MKKIEIVSLFNEDYRLISFNVLGIEVCDHINAMLEELSRTSENRSKEIIYYVKPSNARLLKIEYGHV